MPRSRTARKKSSSKSRSRAHTIRSRRIQRHVVKPATADEIIRGVGATAADLRIVDRILAQILPRSASSSRTKRR